MPCFPGKIHRKSLEIVNYYGDSKLLRHSIFSTAGSFGVVLANVPSFGFRAGGTSSETTLLETTFLGSLGDKRAVS